MTAIETIAEMLGSSDVWADGAGVHWLATGNLNVRQVATKMRECEARFVTINATQLPRDEGICLDYIWEVAGESLGFAFYLSGSTIESIHDICSEADTAQREVHEGLDVEFLGREYEMAAHGAAR